MPLWNSPSGAGCSSSGFFCAASAMTYRFNMIACLVTVERSSRLTRPASQAPAVRRDPLMALVRGRHFALQNCLLSRLQSPSNGTSPLVTPQAPAVVERITGRERANRKEGFPGQSPSRCDPGGGTRWPRHSRDPGLSRPPLDHVHGPLHGFDAEPIQKLLEGLIFRASRINADIQDRPSFLAGHRHIRLVPQTDPRCSLRGWH